MANEADSRHTTPTLRWGETSSEVPDANVVEPSGGKKDTGWNPGAEGLVGEWLNWVSWAAGVFNRYVERTWQKMLPRDCVSTSADESVDGIVTAGSGGGLAVDVSACDCWLEGGLYAVPAVVDLALAAADATNPRIDLIVAHLSGGVPEYTVITGTPASSPATPARAAGQALIGSVSVPALATTPSGILDLRERGAVTLDRVIARDRLDAGDSSTIGGAAMQVTGGLAPLVYLGGYDGPTAQIACSPATNRITIEPTHLQFKDPITQQYDLPATGFTESLLPANLGFQSSLARWGQQLGATGSPSELIAPVRIPEGATITQIRAYVERSVNDELITMTLYRVTKGQQTPVVVATVATPDGSGSTGKFTITAGSLSHVVDQANFYFMTIEFTGAGVALTYFYGAEIDYEIDEPWQNVV